MLFVASSCVNGQNFTAGLVIKQLTAYFSGTYSPEVRKNLSNNDYTHVNTLSKQIFHIKEKINGAFV